MIENILILDCETTGLSVAHGAKLIEIAGIVYNVKHKAILQCYSTLFPCTENPAERINHISPMITQLPYCQFTSDVLLMMSNSVDALVAHNAAFDKQFIETIYPLLINRHWICTYRDFQWPISLQKRKLEDLCDALEVPYVHAHRALNDCMFLVKCFNKVENLFKLFNPELFTKIVDKGVDKV